MAKKEFTFRGKKLEDLQSMAVNEFAELCTSRARRSLKRGLSDDQKVLFKKIRSGKKNVKTHSRETVITPELVGHTILVHNGKEYAPVTIMTEMLGHMLGEYSLTRKRVGHNSPGVGATKSSAHVSMK